MYYSRLDTIRFYAVLSVIFAHILQIWTWKINTTFLFPIGNVGVVVFFVLSGFLITNILLSQSNQVSRATRFKNFYWRRILRIFPIYYLYLLIVFSFNLGNIEQTHIYPWLYLTNIYIFQYDTWIDANSHLWTLSIEEQFYIFWPFLIIFLKNKIKLLTVIFIIIILMAMATRLYLFYNAYSISPQIEVFTLANLDSLTLGGLTALLYQKYGKNLKKYGLPIILIGCIIYYGSYWLKAQYGIEFMFWSLGKLGESIFAVGFIIYAIFTPEKQGIFHNSATIHLGKISYGLYLYHNLIVAHYDKIANFFGLTVAPDLSIKIVLSLLFTFIIAQLSFMIIEKPLLKLKDKFRDNPQT